MAAMKTVVPNCSISVLNGVLHEKGGIPVPMEIVEMFSKEVAGRQVEVSNNETTQDRSFLEILTSAWQSVQQRNPSARAWVLNLDNPDPTGGENPPWTPGQGMMAMLGSKTGGGVVQYEFVFSNRADQAVSVNYYLGIMFKPE